MPEKELQVTTRPETQVARPVISSSQILQEFLMSGKVNPENLAMVKELRQMVREEALDDARFKFNQAFLNLQRNMPIIYADKEAKDNSGNPTFAYLSMPELEDKIKPLLLSFGFSYIPGQKIEGDRIVAIVTLIHEGGHEIVREYAMRAINATKMMDGAKVDAGTTTMATRNLLIKMLGLKVRVKDPEDGQNPAILGENIPDEVAKRTQERMKALQFSVKKERSWLIWANVPMKDADIPDINYYRQIKTNDFVRLDLELKKLEQPK